MITRKLVVLFCIFATSAKTNANTDVPEQGDEIFAKVGSAVILVSDYKRELIRSSRNTFYHAKPPESELLSFQRDVADQIINRELMLQQAGGMGLKVNKIELEKELDKYRARALRRGQEIDEEDEPWRLLRQRVEKDLIAAELEKTIKENISGPSEEVLQAYYEAHTENFTEPARFDLSTILLGVAPSAASDSWEAAREEARDIVERLRRGADFAELARIHSSDVSAEDGGALGYSHKGMFSAPAQEVIEKLEIGEISDALQVLEGIVIFRLNGRQPERLMAFEQVRDRVGDLWLRDEQKQYWERYLADIREKTNIEVAERYLTLTGEEAAVPKTNDGE